MDLKWFKRRGYRHFDRPVCEIFAAKVIDPNFVTQHPFSPLLHYIKETKRYDKEKKKVATKPRPIMYASHRDACVLSYYSRTLDDHLDTFYKALGIDKNVVAYRSPGLGNYSLAAAAFRFAVQHSPVVILAFDVTGFFDNLDHGLLKSRLKRILLTPSLPEDWYKVYRFVTRFQYVDLEELKGHPVLGPRVGRKTADPLATVAELKAQGVTFHGNPKPGVGIPQGTPISATLSNLYMIDFDVAARSYCDSIGAFYRRYSDDILVICSPEDAGAAEAKIGELIAAERLSLSDKKTERTLFEVGADIVPGSRTAQYLGFTFREDGAGIRLSSLARQWRKMRRAFRRTRKVAEAAIAAGKADKPYTKRLRRRFTPLQFRNFSSYGRRSAAAFDDGSRIMKQVRRFERTVESEFASLSTLKKP